MSPSKVETFSGGDAWDLFPNEFVTDGENKMMGPQRVRVRDYTFLNPPLLQVQGVLESSGEGLIELEGTDFEQLVQVSK